MPLTESEIVEALTVHDETWARIQLRNGHIVRLILGGGWPQMKSYEQEICSELRRHDAEWALDQLLCGKLVTPAHVDYGCTYRLAPDGFIERKYRGRSNWVFVGNTSTWRAVWFEHATFEVVDD